MTFLRFVVLMAGVSFISSVSGQLTEQWINQRLSTEVIAPFQASLTQYNGLLSELWTQLQSYDPKSIIPLEIDNSVKNHSENFVKNLHESSENCKTLQTDTIKFVQQEAEAVSAIEKDIERQSGMVANANVQVQASQNAVNLASTVFNNAKANLATHQQSLRHAEDRYNKAKHDCLGKRRRKRGFFSKVWGGVKNVAKKIGGLPKKAVKGIYSGICHGIGALTGKINDEKNNVRDVQNQVNQAQAHLTAKQTELNNAKNALTSMQQTLTRLQQQKAAVHKELLAAQQKKASVIATNAKMMKTVGFLDGIKAQGDAISIPMELGFILDIENVVTPLKDISADLQKLGVAGVGGFVPSISPANILQMKTIINQINVKTD